MRSRRSIGGRRLAVVIGSLLSAAAFVASAPAEHGLLELLSTGPAGGNGAFVGVWAESGSACVSPAGDRAGSHTVKE
jgi:hypothetical protein